MDRDPSDPDAVDLARLDGLTGELQAVLGADGRVHHRSPSWSRLLADPAGDLPALTHPEDRDRALAQLARAAADGGPAVLEIRLRTADGAHRLVRWDLDADPGTRRVYAVGRVVDGEPDRDLRTSEALFRKAFDDAVIGMSLTGADGRFELVNPAFASMLDRSPQELVGLSWTQVTHPDDLDASGQALQSMLSGEASGFSDHKRYLRRDGTVVEAYVSATMVRDAAGRPQHVVTQVLDVTERRQAREQAERTSAFAAAVLAASPDVIHILDASTAKAVFSTRTTHGDVVTEPDLLDLADPVDRPRITATLLAAGDLEDGQVLQMRFRATDAHGRTRWLSSRLTPFRRDDAGGLLEVLCVRRDITDAVAAEDQLHHAAGHDALTDLPNRSLLAERMSQALAASRTAGEQVAVLFCDLDGFKRINDTAGHGAGDAVLLSAARRLRRVVRTEDTVARVGGDEFVVLLAAGQRQGSGPGAASQEQVRARTLDVAGRIVAAFGKPVTVDGVEHSVSISVGIAYAGGSTGVEEPHEVLRDADAAMYRAKALGKDRFEVFESSLRGDLVERDHTERLLRRALAHHPAGGIPRSRAPGRPTLDVAYQPVCVNATGELVGFEALARLTDDDGRSIPPEDFIRVAEGSGLIRPLGYVVLQRACAQLATWLPSHPGLTMAVNLSTRQAQHAGLVEEVMAAVEAAGVPADRLVLELTETVLLEAAESTLSAFRELRAAGIEIAIDDFGTGYSSLRYLAELPVGIVKVDRSFTSALPDDRRSLTIVRAVAGLAEDLSLRCVVEGVETEQQRAALPHDVLLQGWLLGRPAFAPDVVLPAPRPVPA